MSAAVGSGVQALFPHARGYLDTATVGLPPSTVGEAMRAGIEEWERGQASPHRYDEVIDRSRDGFARLVSVPASAVAVGSQVSGFVGLLAASLPAGARVLCPEGEFTSVLFPFLVREREGVQVTTAPLEHLADLVEEGGTDVVAFSLVQSSDGRVADAEAIRAAAERQGTVTFVDATQAVGWFPVDARRFDFVAAGAYKWLLSPRGTAFLTVGSRQLDRLRPFHAGWYAGEHRWDSIYGGPLRLAEDARRFDLSPAWLCWVGTAAALELVENIGVAAINEHDVGLANALRSRLGLAPSDSAVVSVTVPGGCGDLPPGVRASVRSGRLRVCFHLYNTDEDVDLVAGYLSGRSAGP